MTDPIPTSGGWADCFTQDGVFKGVYGTFSARVEVDRFEAESIKIMQTLPNLRHFVTNIPTEVDGEWLFTERQVRIDGQV